MVDGAGLAAESDGSEEAAEAVENLLESYFMQIDGTYDRLVSIGKPLFYLSLLPQCGTARRIVSMSACSVGSRMETVHAARA